MQGRLILDRYRRIGTKGTGGSGTVDICWDTTLQRRVAIKRMFLTTYGIGPGEGVPGLLEARTGAMLTHPSIVSVIDFVVEGEEALLIMEAIEGPTLTEVIDGCEEGTLDLDIIAAVTEAVGDALDFAHENQVLHLDIKPDNILIDRGGHVKVTDFGISELADAQGFGEATGGTIGYMPPEQMNGLALDQRCDLFALAMVVYEMLTGTNPFWAPQIDMSLDAERRFEVDPPSAFRDDIDPELDEIVLAAMQPDREDRPLTVVDFLQEIDEYLGDRATGVAKLKQMASIDDEDDADESDAETAGVGAWDRFTPTQRNVAGRICSAVLCWWTAALGITCIQGVETGIAMLIALLPALAALFMPSLGAVLSLAVLAIGIIATPALPPALGIAVLLAAVVWWLLVGRDSGPADVTCPLITAPLGLISFTPLAPLAIGFCLPWRRALVAGALSALIGLTLSIATTSGSILHFGLFINKDGTAIPLFEQLLTQPAVWIIIFGWVLSAFSMSVACSRATRVLSIVGAICSGVILVLAQVCAQWITTGAWQAPDFAWGISCALAVAVMILIGALGAPYRTEGED